MVPLEDTVSVHALVLHKLLTKLYHNQQVSWVENGGSVKSGVVVEVSRTFEFVVEVWGRNGPDWVNVNYQDVI